MNQSDVLNLLHPLSLPIPLHTTQPPLPYKRTFSPTQNLTYWDVEAVLSEKNIKVTIISLGSIYMADRMLIRQDAEINSSMIQLVIAACLTIPVIIINMVIQLITKTR